MKQTTTTFICTLLLALPALAQEKVGVEDFIRRATNQAEAYKSIDLSIQALSAEIAGRDLNTSSSLILDGFQINDKKDSFTNNINRRADSKLLGLTYQQYFSTGTNALLSTAYEKADQNTFATSPLYRADWQVTLTQDLWQNGFGRGTGLRSEANQAELKSRGFDLLLRRQTLLTGFEGTYWDLALLYKQLEIQQINLKKSEEILNWTRRRLNMSAARDTDLLQAQALVAGKRLDLAQTQDQIETAWVQMQQVLPDVQIKTWQPDLTALDQERSLPNLFFSRQSVGGIVTQSHLTTTPAQLDTLSAQYRQAQIDANVRQLKDDLAPRLQLEFSHGRNGIRDNWEDAASRAGGDDTIYNSVGLSLTIDLDVSLNAKKREALALQSQATQVEAQRLSRVNKLNWEDLNRRVAVLKENLKLATELAGYQRSKSEKERRNFLQGRSTVFQAVTFEVDASEAELRVYQLLNQIRKIESQARLFGYANQEG